MPHCQNCDDLTPREELIEHTPTGALLCMSCAASSDSVLDFTEGFDYDFSYSRKFGLKASASFGRSSIRLHIPKEELVKVFR